MLRITFITLALRARYTDMQMAWLVGHENGEAEALAGSHYHTSYSLSMLKEIVEAMRKFTH